MANAIGNRELWIPLDWSGDNEAITLQGTTGLIFKGGNAELMFAVYETMPQSQDAPGVFRNHSAITSFVFKIRSGSYAGTLLLDSNSGGTTSLNPNPPPDEEDFIERSAAPIRILLPYTITAITAGDHYFTFSAVLNNGEQFDGRGRISVLDIGLGAVDSVAPASPTAATTDWVLGLINGCVKYGKNPSGKTATFVSPNGAFGRTKGADDDGNEMSVLETY